MTNNTYELDPECVPVFGYIVIRPNGEELMDEPMSWLETAYALLETELEEMVIAQYRESTQGEKQSDEDCWMYQLDHIEEIAKANGYRITEVIK